jgi:predicted 3-demethylubiquinone-9 3-methyltransferase (glyoxalase superfamily)
MDLSTCLWFDNQAEEAVEFYLSVFPDAKRLGSSEAGGRVMTVSFEIGGRPFVALNGGPMYHFTEAVSFVIQCDSQREVDDYWAKLTDGGQEGRCGWLKDRFGLSWQVVPRAAMALLKYPKAMAAMMKMNKLNLAELQSAAAS